jgi:hypothetical protein
MVICCNFSSNDKKISCYAHCKYYEDFGGNVQFFFDEHMCYHKHLYLTKWHT